MSHSTNKTGHFGDKSFQTSHCTGTELATKLTATKRKHGSRTHRLALTQSDPN